MSTIEVVVDEFEVVEVVVDEFEVVEVVEEGPAGPAGPAGLSIPTEIVNNFPAAPMEGTLYIKVQEVV